MLCQSRRFIGKCKSNVLSSILSCRMGSGRSCARGIRASCKQSGPIKSMILLGSPLPRLNPTYIDLVAYGDSSATMILLGSPLARLNPTYIDLMAYGDSGATRNSFHPGLRRFKTIPRGRPCCGPHPALPRLIISPAPALSASRPRQPHAPRCSDWRTTCRGH